jgi:hypothetical protein
LIEQLPTNISVNYLGAKPNYELNAILKRHHLYILPTEGENFGHSIFEAFLAGRPALVSDQTPWINLKVKKIGWDLPLNNMKAYNNAIDEAAAWNQEEFDEWSSNSWAFANDGVLQSGEVEKYEEIFS